MQKRKEKAAKVSPESRWQATVKGSTCVLQQSGQTAIKVLQK